MKTVNKITALFLAAIFLFFSLGFTLGSMACLKSGEKKVSMAVIEDCCSQTTACCDDENETKITATSTTTIQKSDCCNINNISFKLNEFKSAQTFSLEQTAVVISLFHHPSTFTIENNSSVFTKQYSELPQPLHGRQLLSFISTLTI